jgi:hypothetical protein
MEPKNGPEAVLIAVGVFSKMDAQGKTSASDSLSRRMRHAEGATRERPPPAHYVFSNLKTHIRIHNTAACATIRIRRLIAWLAPFA